MLILATILSSMHHNLFLLYRKVIIILTATILDFIYLINKLRVLRFSHKLLLLLIILQTILGSIFKISLSSFMSFRILLLLLLLLSQLRVIINGLFI